MLTKNFPDEEMADAPEQIPEEPTPEEPTPENTEMETAEQKQPEPAPVESRPISSHRRRGRRQVMKKKTTRDAEGYIGMYRHASMCAWGFLGTQYYTNIL